MRKRRRLTLGALIGGLLFILGLVDVPDQIAKWAEVFSLLEGDRGRWLVVLLGLVVIAVAAFPELRELATRALTERATESSGPANTTPAAVEPDSRDPSPERSEPQDPEGAAEESGAPDPPPSAAVSGERTLRPRLANVVVARVEQARDLRRAFDEYIETFLARRADYREGMNAEQLHRAREEYGHLQRRAARAYRQVRAHYRRFLREEPQYDRSSNDPLNYVPEEPLPHWWEALTFDAALNNYANADDEHLRAIIAEEHAILDAFIEWIAEPRHHDLADEMEGLDRENDEILRLIGRQLAQQEIQEAARRNRATLSARQGSISGREFGDQYNFEVMNTGPAAAREARAWAASPEGPPVTGPAQMHTLPPDHRWYPVTLEIGRQAFGQNGLDLVVAWDDASGPREERLLGIRPLQR